MKDRIRASVKGLFHATWRDAFISVAVLLLTSLLCMLLHSLSNDGDYDAMLFILAVFVIARLTDGYLCGIVSSLISVLAVNYFFTFPYFRFNFTLAGYPITILSMLAVSIATSALTSNAKKNGEIRVEAEKEKTRSNLLRAVSHDLRTPLTSIGGAISVILESGDTLPKEEQRALLAVAQSEAQWLIRMVENLLIVTRIDDSRQGKVQKVPEPAEEVISGAVMKFQKRFPAVAIEVEIENDALLIPMDAVLIEQVLQNLMENAALHGHTTDRIRLRMYEEAGRAVFRVHDNGDGIEAAKLPHLFDGYLLGADETEGDSKRNMGIGLSVCNAIILAHDGTMRGYNDPSGGAVFEFSLDV